MNVLQSTSETMRERPAAGLRAQFAKGVVWTTAETYGSATLNFLVAVLLARILSSSDFGLAAAASVVTLFFFVIIDAAASTIVQHRDASRAQTSTVFWCCEAVLVGLYLLIFVSAPWAASLAHMPALTSVLRVACLQLPLLGLLIVPLALLRSKLRFRELAISQISAAIISGGVAIVLALNGFGYWALVLQGVTLIAARVPMVWQLSGFRPLRVVHLAETRALTAYAGGLLGFTTINYWSRNFDVLLVSRIFGAHLLGYYSMAYRLIGVPVQLVTSALRPPLHPAFVAMEGDDIRMRRAYLQLARSTALITFPIGAVLWAGADVIVNVVWGPGWEPAANVLRGLALLAAVQPVNSLSASVYMAKGATGLLLKISLANAVVFIVAVVVGLRFGLVGVAWANSLAYALIIAPLSTGVAASRLLSTEAKDLARALAPGTLAGAIVVAIALIVGAGMR